MLAVACAILENGEPYPPDYAALQPPACASPSEFLQLLTPKSNSARGLQIRNATTLRLRSPRVTLPNPPSNADDRPIASPTAQRRDFDSNGFKMARILIRAAALQLVRWGVPPIHHHSRCFLALHPHIHPCPG